MSKSEMYLSERELVAKGWSSDVLRAAIRSGKLNGVFQGTSFIVREDHLQEWADLQLPKGRPTGRTAAAPAPAPGAGRIPAPGGSAKTAWNQAVADHVAAGLSRDKAVAAVDRKHPGLREQMLREVNRR